MGDEKSFTNTEDLVDILEKLNQYRKANIHSDVILKVGDLEFPAHRNILSVSSGYFQNVTIDDGENPGEQKGIIIMKPDINPQALEILLDYMYTGVLNISGINAPELYKLGEHLQLEWVKEQCRSFLDSLTPAPSEKKKKK